MNQSHWQSLYQAISAATGDKLSSPAVENVGGGCINQAYRVRTDSKDYFVKLNDKNLADMFVAEAEGLAELASAKAIAVPSVVCYGIVEQYSYLVLDWFETGIGGNDSHFGEQLATLHRHEKAQFGWHRDNTIGATHQPNDWTADWVSFWQQQRLGFQLELAEKNGHGGKLQTLGAQLLERIPDFFTDYQARPSLLHGDLWSGNYASLKNGEIIIFDPAVYYGDREADLAMTELFGRFPADFYAAYNATYPLDSGYSVRKQLYNLYHIINHLNLFGGGYHGQSLRMLESLLSQILLYKT